MGLVLLKSYGQRMENCRSFGVAGADGRISQDGRQDECAKAGLLDYNGSWRIPYDVDLRAVVITGLRSGRRWRDA